MKKLVLFGAGKIGRSFIGQLFARSGYEVVFVDINTAVIDELNRRGKYKVVIKSDQETILWIENVRGILASEKAKVIREIADADLMAISVGQRNLAPVFPLIAEGLLKRHSLASGLPLDIIIAENMRDADQYLSQGLKNHLPADYPFDRLVGLVETSIGKMVPIMPPEEEKNDILQVFAEPYNTLIVDKNGFRNPVPDVEGLDAQENMKAWVDCKSYIHNFGHATVAYIGFLYEPGFMYIHEPLSVPEVKNFAREAMFQSAAILMKKYKDAFSYEFISGHVDDLIYRFQNKALGDTLFRAGCDLTRKLGRFDRIVSPLMDGIKFSMDIDKILLVLVCGYFFRAKGLLGELLREDADFVHSLEAKGFPEMLKETSGIIDPVIQQKAKQLHDKLPHRLRELLYNT